MPARAQLGVEVEVKGDEQAARLLAGMAKHGADPRPALRQISDELRAAEDPWFRTHGDGTWADLAEATKLAKQAQGYPDNPLVRTGALGGTLTVRSGARSIRKVTKAEMHFGTSLFYAKFHAIGSSVQMRNPVVPVNAESRRRMVYDIKRYVMTGQLSGNAVFR